MEENLNSDEEKKKICSNYIVSAILVAILFFTWIWIILWLFFLLRLYDNEPKMDPKCYKIVNLICWSPFIVLPLIFWWCIITFL